MHNLENKEYLGDQNFQLLIAESMVIGDEKWNTYSNGQRKQSWTKGQWVGRNDLQARTEGQEIFVVCVW